MTQLKKAVRRETPAMYRGRNIIIQLEPGGIVRLKEKGRRTWYETSINSVFNLAAKQYADKIRAERKAARKARK